MSHVANFVSKFTVLRGAVRELWIIYLTKVLEILAYGMMSSALILWLSADLGYSDVQAGYMIALWSTILSIVTMMVGSLTDAVGIRKAFLLGFGVCVVSRGVMAFTTAKWIVLPFGLLLLAVGLALMVPVMTAALKRYSTTAQRSMAFSMFYVLMNVGFAIAGWAFDYVRGALGEYGTYKVPVIGVELSTYRVLFLLGFLFTIPGFVITLFGLRDGIEVTEEGVKVAKIESKYKGEPILQALWHMVADTARDTARIFVTVWKQPAFHRFLIFLALVVGVKLVFYHMHYTFPKYGIRELGQGAPIGRLFGMLNPVIIVLLVPFVGALTQKISAYKMIMVGSTVSALSVFIMAMPPELFTTLANGWLGHFVTNTWLGMNLTEVNPLYISITIAVTLFSVGEAIWSPRLYEYTAAIAPKGQEGSYMALSTLPYFLAKFVVGMLSGALLQKYCPPTGERNSEMMWFIIALMAAISPLGLLVFRKYLQVKEQGREEAPAHAAAVKSDGTKAPVQS
ncbi:MAG: MFS transporter [Oligoflexia bacterium]|nr:MFS transporter [Oligoflexia bacterium]